MDVDKPLYKIDPETWEGEAVVKVVVKPQVSRADVLKLIETRRKENWRCEDPRFDTFNRGWHYALDEIENYLLGKAED